MGRRHALGVCPTRAGGALRACGLAGRHVRAPTAGECSRHSAHALALVQASLDLQSEIQLRYFSVIQGVIVTVLNMTVSYLIAWTTTLERHFTDTFHKRALVAKLSLFYLVNSFVVPIVTAALRSGSYRLWCAASRCALSTRGPATSASCCACCTMCSAHRSLPLDGD